MAADIPDLGAKFPRLGKQLGSGTYGKVYAVLGETKQIAKVFLMGPLDDYEIEDLVQEVTIQQKLYENVPGSCPKIYAFGKGDDDQGDQVAVVVMEQCEGTARSWLKLNGGRDEAVLDYLEQIANIMKRAKPFNFNHRDLKSDNIMYKTVMRENKSGKVKPQKDFLLIDFGFSCATFDKVKYEGTAYFVPGSKCFRESRDLALLVYEMLSFSKQYITKDMTKFAQLLLTFDYKGKTCDMSKGCLPDFDGDWLKLYDFLDTDDVENPNTTPDGLLNAIAAYRTKGIAACEKDGFILDPVKDACVPDPGPPIAAALKPAVSPGKGHMASPTVVAKTGGKKHTRRHARSHRKTTRRKRGGV